MSGGNGKIGRRAFELRPIFSDDSSKACAEKPGLKSSQSIEAKPLLFKSKTDRRSERKNLVIIAPVRS